MTCQFCGDTGFRRVEERRVTRCECFHVQREQKLLAGSGIPKNYWESTLDNFDCSGPRLGLSYAHAWAKEFAKSYPLEGERGVCLIGSIGAGKTHLSVGILKQLIAKGFPGRFSDCATLLQDIRGSYDPQSDESEMRMLLPLMTIPVLLLDDVGASRPTPWVMETMDTLLDSRYRRNLTTLLTTNYPLQAKQEGDPTLEHRLGERTVSRLYAMCDFVEMYGPDHRLTFNRKNRGLKLVSA